MRDEGKDGDQREPCVQGAEELEDTDVPYSGRERGREEGREGGR